MNEYDQDGEESEYVGLSVFWIYTAFGPHRGILLEDGRAFYFTTKPAGGRTSRDCVIVEEYEDGFDRISHLNLFEPLFVEEYQTGIPRAVCGILSKHSSRGIMSKIRHYYGEVCFV